MKAEKALANLDYFNEMDREELHDQVLKELAPLKDYFKSVDNEHGESAFDTLMHAVLESPDMVLQHVQAAAKVAKESDVQED